MVRWMNPRIRRAAQCAGLCSAFACIPVDSASEPTGAAGGGSRHSNWPMFRGNPQQTGVATSSLPDKLTVRWRTELKEPVTSTAAIVDGVVYVGADDNALHAIDLSTGAILWQYTAKEIGRAHV